MMTLRFGSVLLALVFASAYAVDQKRPAAEILEDLEQIEWPGLLSGLSKEKMAELVDRNTELQCALVEELWRDHPEHPELPDALHGRWTLIRNVFHDYRRVFGEANEVMDEGDGPLYGTASYARAASALLIPKQSESEVFTFLELALSEELPGGSSDELKAHLLSEFAWVRTSEPTKQKRLIAHVLKDYRSTQAAHEAVALYKTLKHVGVEPEFRYVDEGRERSLADHRGSPVVLVVFSGNSFNRGSDRFLHLQALAELREAGTLDSVDVLGVYADDSEWGAEQLADATEEYRLDFPIHREGRGGVLKSLSIRNMPCFLWLSEKGEIQRVSGSPRTLLTDG